MACTRLRRPGRVGLKRWRRVRSARFPSGVGTTYNAANSSVTFTGMQAKHNDTATMRGREAEERAARHLERCGQRIVERNFRVRGGEIDLILSLIHI